MPVPLRDYQVRADRDTRIAIKNGARKLVLLGACRSGKCLGIGTPVLRHDGRTVAVETIEAGDLLMGPDGSPRRVLSTAMGLGPLFRVVPIKGDSWVCNDAHVLTLVDYVTGKVIDIDVKSYLKATANFRIRRKQFTPTDGIDFAAGPPLPLDPYFLGVWYGDGTKALRGVAISKPDPEIRELCESIAKTFDCHVRVDGDPCPTYHIVHRLGSHPNVLLNLLRDIFGNGDVLPHAYLTSSRKNREAFLAGLLDSDGYLQGGCYEICQKVRGFSDGICYLARSLGMRASTREKRVNGASYWCVRLSGEFSALPMRIPRKRALPRQRHQSVTRTGITLEPIGVGPYAGFELDGDGRFLLGDFTVTHNTVLSAHILDGAIRKTSPGIFVAQRKQLIEQCYEKLIHFGLPPAHVGVLMAKDKRANDQALIQVASMQTMARNGAYPPARTIIWDEAHHSGNESCMRLRAARPDAIDLALTATPMLTPTKGMGSIGYEVIIQVVKPSELIAGGWLLEPAMYRTPGKLPDLSGVRTKDGDFDEEEMGAVMNKGELIGDIVSNWQRLAQFRGTVVFACTVEHSKAICARFRAAGIPAEHIDADTPAPIRASIFQRFALGIVKVLCNYGVLLEGWDAPSCKCVVWARGTQNPVTWIQGGCRGSTPWVDHPESTALLLDHAGNWQRFQFAPTDDQEYSLEGRVTTPRLGFKTCTKCYSLVRSTSRTCVGCGADFESAEARGTSRQEAPAELAGELVPVRKASGPEMYEYWDKACKTCAERDWDPGSVWHRYKARFGKGPSPKWGPASIRVAHWKAQLRGLTA